MAQQRAEVVVAWVWASLPEVEEEDKVLAAVARKLAEAEAGKTVEEVVVAAEAG